MEGVVVFKSGSLLSPATGFRPYAPQPCALATLTVSDDGGVVDVATPNAAGSALVTLSASLSTRSVAVTATSESAPPSMGRLCAVASMAAAPSNSRVVADGTGNVALLKTPLADELEAKRKRQDDSADIVLRSTCGELMPGAFEPVGIAGSVHIAAMGGPSVLVAREFYRDVRLFSLGAPGRVERSFYSIHFPRAIAPSESHHGFVLAEGPVVSQWDTRAASACVHRLTLLDNVADVAIVNDTVYVVSTDRSLTLYDMRRWARGLSLQAVTKNPISSILPSRDGSHCIIAGSDTEAKHVSTVAGKAPEVAAERQGAGEAHFRQKFDNSINCEYSWYGRWVRSQCGTAALGMSATGEMYVLPNFSPTNS